ncbi:hypothetical protein LTR84_004572 [Exophiala bonariae]|uniref:Prion-inhibition and propagation HeLo domain-containing protein n=1 Tax=Exophiala bonariae TaxID=1690606 RepID=A0AAV9NMH6_9EURO|nr:hypothetical protein LTR84_004572 [Exophiala bonariae]
MKKQDLTASRWASPDVRQMREYPRITRTPSPQKTPWNGSLFGDKWHENTPLPSITHSTTSSDPCVKKTSVTPQPLGALQRQFQTRQLDLQRFQRLFRRLKWKANSLTHWSHRALSLTQEHIRAQQMTREVVHAHPSPQRNPTTSLGRYEMEIDPIEAERQFKIDFYEFYALLERGIVCLLGVWGMAVDSSNNSNTRENDPDNMGPAALGSGNLIGNSRAFHGSSHRFHANLLAALDHPSNPLHLILGTGDARDYIGIAKEFRNKWKDVEVRPDEAFQGDERLEEEWDRKKARRYEKVLRDLKLDELLGSVLGALEMAGSKAEQEVDRLALALGATANDRITLVDTAGVDSDMVHAPFEVGYNPMDYDIEMQL